jgi:hypothetical protein
VLGFVIDSTCDLWIVLRVVLAAVLALAQESVMICGRVVRIVCGSVWCGRLKPLCE